MYVIKFVVIHYRSKRKHTASVRSGAQTPQKRYPDSTRREEVFIFTQNSCVVPSMTFSKVLFWFSMRHTHTHTHTHTTRDHRDKTIFLFIPRSSYSIPRFLIIPSRNSVNCCCGLRGNKRKSSPTEPWLCSSEYPPGPLCYPSISASPKVMSCPWYSRSQWSPGQ